MARTGAIVALALALAGCATPEGMRLRGRHLDIVFPPGSPVAPVATDEPAAAHFAGRFTMTGRIHVETAAAGADPVLYFVPDERIARHLPYFADLGRVQRIEFDNPATFLEDAIPADIRTRLASGGIAAVAGRARIVVDGLHASVDCDQPAYAVSFVAAELVELAAVPRASPPDRDGC
jgi:hypothetical protein